MRKFLFIILAMVFLLGLTGTALAAPNPFVDVPANHWAYDAINILVRNKIVDGYGDATFRGDRTMTRYEAAQITAKAMARNDKATAEVKTALDKLQVEFAAELQNLGVRVDKLEKNASSIKFTGSTRIRYQNGMLIGTGSVAKDGENKNQSRFQQRLRLNMVADVTENVQFFGGLRSDNTSNKDKKNSGAAKTDISRDPLWVERAEFVYSKGNFSLSAGRSLPVIGQGYMIWSACSADGIQFSWKFNKTGAFSLGYLDLAPGIATNYTYNIAYASLLVPIGNQANVSLAYAKQMNDINGSYFTAAGGIGFADTKNYNVYKQFAYGFNAQLGQFFNLSAEGVRNSATDLPANAQKNGWFARLSYRAINLNKPGTYSLYFDYMNLGNWAIDSYAFGHGLNVAGGNGYNGDGAKGWGFGVQYVLAKNINIEANYYSLKPYDSNLSGFSSYKNSYGITTNFKF